MQTFRVQLTVLATALLALIAAPPALAVTNYIEGVPTPYVAAFAPAFGISGIPHSGRMVLIVRGNTVIGRYTGTSIQPDRLDDRIVPVTGAIDSGDGAVQLQIGEMLSFTGRMEGDGTLSGEATYNGRLYEFVASPSSLSHPT